MDVDLIELGRYRPLVGVLGALRLLPEIIGHLLQGEPPPAAPKRMHLRDTVAIPASNGVGASSAKYPTSSSPWAWSENSGDL